MILDYLSRYFTAISLIATFCGGWYGGYTYYDVKQLKIDLNTSNEVIENKNKLIVTNEQNLKNRDDENLSIKNDRDIIKTKYEQQVKVNANDKEYINKHNVITSDLLRRVGALQSENNKLSKNITAAVRVSSTDTTVSAYDYVQWAAGLKAHDDACVMSFNGLQSFYNKQRILNNGFK